MYLKYCPTLDGIIKYTDRMLSHPIAITFLGLTNKDRRESAHFRSSGHVNRVKRFSVDLRASDRDNERVELARGKDVSL